MLGCPYLDGADDFGEINTVTARRLNVVLSMPWTLAMDTSTPPLGLLMLAAVAEVEHAVKVVFPIDIDEVLEGLPESLADVDVFGLSVNSFNWIAAYKAIEKLRRHLPHTKIVLGGPHPTFYDHYCLEHSAADAVVRGEGEATFPELLRAWAQDDDLSDVNGVTWKDADGAIHYNPERPLLSEPELDRLPLPAYHLIPPARYSFVPMETSRGCLFRCVFCAIPFSNGIRQFSLDRVERNLSRLNELRERFLQRAIFLSDDSFSAHRERAQGTLHLAREVTPDFMLGCEARINEILKNDLMPFFSKCRLFLIQVGVECGYEQGLRRIKKGLSIRKVMEFARTVVNMPFRYQIYWSYVIGFPWETEKEILQTINFAFNTARISGSQQPQVNSFSPYPGSPLAARPHEFGLAEVTPRMYDDPSWFNRFIGYSRVAESDKAFIQSYLHTMHNAYPYHVHAPVLSLPSGITLDNAVLQ